MLQCIESEYEAENVAGELVRQIAMPIMLSGGRRAEIGASIGISYITPETTDVHLIVQQADSASYAAKAAGRNAARVFEPQAERGRPTLRAGYES